LQQVREFLDTKKFHLRGTHFFKLKIKRGREGESGIEKEREGERERERERRRETEQRGAMSELKYRIQVKSFDFRF
jgi:hypothetical protein